MSNTAESKWLTVRDLCSRFQLSRASIYALVQRGSLPRPTKIGRAARWREAEIASAEQRFTTADAGRCA